MADYYTLLTDAGIAYETACKAAGTPIKLSQLSVGDGGGSVYNPAATATRSSAKSGAGRSMHCSRMRKTRVGCWPK